MKNSGRNSLSLDLDTKNIQKHPTNQKRPKKIKKIQKLSKPAETDEVNESPADASGSGTKSLPERCQVLHPCETSVVSRFNDHLVCMLYTLMAVKGKHTDEF